MTKYLNPGNTKTVAEFVAIASPGDTYIFSAGRYTDADDMIVIDGLNGTADNPITFQARGQVILDGEGVTKPIFLDNCSHIIVDGFDACNSSGSVAYGTSCDDCVIRNTMAWNAHEGNYTIFSFHSGNRNQFIDCAGFGTARKIFTCSQGGNDTTFTRCFGRWERCISIGPKMAYSMSYNSSGTRLDDCIGMFDARMPKEYYLLDNDGITEYVPQTLMADYEIDQPFGIISADANTGDADVIATRCLAYSKSLSNPSTILGGFFTSAMDGMSIQDCVSAIIDDVGIIKPFYLNTSNDDAYTNNIASGLISIGGGGADYINPYWGGTGIDGVVATINALRVSWQSSPMLDRIREQAGVVIDDIFVDVLANMP